jgi:hypothetical protein
MLLALWLVHGRDGNELARVAQLPSPSIGDRLSHAMARLLPRRNIARRTTHGREAFAHWLRLQLQLTAEPLPDTLLQPTIDGWHQALRRVRDLLLVAVERQRLPSTVRDAIEAALMARDDETPAWQQWLGWVALAALVFAVGWIFVRPPAQTPAAQTAASTAPQPQPGDAQTLVQHALDTWTTMPVSGTLHRRVWAVDERPSAHDQVHTTEVWLASDTPQYRVETTRDGKLIEWHVVDNRDRLHITSDVPFNMCHWSYGASVVARRAQTFTVPPEEIRAIRDERLRSGSYGAGYRMLRRAFAAPDLRSYGVRTEGERVLVTLGFRDETEYRQGAPARTVLLLLDGRTHALQAVRELVGDAAQTTARDLWRLDGEETLPAVPAAVPPVQGESTVVDHVIDPACPGLTRDSVVSLRKLTALSYGQIQIPTPLPPHVVQAAFVNPSPVDTGGYPEIFNVQLVLRSTDGWLRIRPSQGGDPNSSAPNVVERGKWMVQFKDAGYISAPVAATVSQKMDDPSTRYYVQPIEIEASGWTREQVLDVVDRLQPLDERTWPMLAPKFLDPYPLPPDVVKVLTNAQHALATLPDGTIHVTMNATARAGTQLNERTDPYHVPSSITAPNAWIVQQWATISDTEAVQFKQVATGADGTLLSAESYSPTQSGWYEARVQQADRSAQGEFNPFRYGYNNQRLGVDLARPLLAWDAPISMTADDNEWRFEQVLPATAADLLNRGYWYQLIQNSALTSTSPVDNLPLGDLVQRVSFDRAQFLPRRWELVRRTEGGEIVLQRIEVRAWQAVDAPPEDAFWTLPPLPPDTIINTFEPSSAPAPASNDVPYVPQPSAIPPTIATVGGPIPTTPPQRALVWQAESGITIERDEPYRSPATVTAQWPGAMLMDMLLHSGDPDGIQRTGIVRSTRYKLPDRQGLVAVTQGPRALLRYLLQRTDGAVNTFVDSFSGYQYAEQSEGIQVTIAGEQHDAWLLRGASQGALVVEIDDMLLHISGSADYVGGVMLEQLLALEWEPVVLTQGGGGPLEVKP